MATKNIHIWAASGGLKAASSAADLKIEAHSGSLNAAAANDVLISGTEKKVGLLAQNEVELKVGGSSISVEAGK